MNEPIFEIVQGTHHYKIYEDGSISGFPGGVKVINRLNGHSKDRAVIREGAEMANEYFRKHGRVR